MELTRNQRIGLSKICVEASKSAGVALKQMIQREVTVNFPNVDLREITSSENQNTPYIVVRSGISGDISGEMIFAYPIQKGMQLIDLIMLQEINTATELTDDAKSAFIEFVNIVGGIFLSKMADILKFSIFPNPPVFTLDMQFNQTTLPKLKAGGDMFMIDTVLSVEATGVGGEFFILFDDASLSKIMDALATTSSDISKTQSVVDALDTNCKTISGSGDSS